MRRLKSFLAHHKFDLGVAWDTQQTVSEGGEDSVDKQRETSHLPCPSIKRWLSFLLGEYHSTELNLFPGLACAFRLLPLQVLAFVESAAIEASSG